MVENHLFPHGFTVNPTGLMSPKIMSQNQVRTWPMMRPVQPVLNESWLTPHLQCVMEINHVINGLNAGGTDKMDKCLV
jgi:ABC-type thiamine transport system ATPase subunit